MRRLATKLLIVTTAILLSIQAGLCQENARSIANVIVDNVEKQIKPDDDREKIDKLTEAELKNQGIDSKSTAAVEARNLLKEKYPGKFIEKEAAPTAGGSNFLANLDFAFGIGSEHYKTAYVQKASLNGTTKIVTIDEENDQVTSAWLTTGLMLLKTKDTSKVPIGIGPYVGLKVVGLDGTTFDAISVGIQAFLIKDRSTKKSINIGAGWVSHKTQTLAQGITEGNPLPTQYDEIKYQKRSEGSWMLMISSSF